MGNGQLVSYGIQSCSADVLIFVCPLAAALYVMLTAHAKKAIGLGRYFQGSTFSGWITSLGLIDGIAEIPIPSATMAHVAFSSSDSTSEKGRKANVLVGLMLAAGQLPLPQNPQIIPEDDPRQWTGQDMILPQLSLEIKCDCRGGSKERGASGAIFLQTAESNDLKQH